MPILTDEKRLPPISNRPTAPFPRAMTGYKFKCKDIGMKCDFEVKAASSRDEAMQIATVHAKQAHKMDTVPSDVAAKISAAIKS